MLLALTALATSATAFAQTAAYPTKVVRWVVPFAAGGGTDVVARPIALAMGDVMGQPVAYDNRGGGNGMIAGEIVARAAPDGYTLLVGSPSIMTTNQHLYAKMPFDPLKDFVRRSVKFASVPNLLIAHPVFPARTIQELIEYRENQSRGAKSIGLHPASVPADTSRSSCCRSKPASR